MTKQIRIAFIVVLGSIFFHAFGQNNLETATFISYNLTFYRETSTFCTGNNNNPTVKDEAMAKIAAFVKPDVLMLQEIGSQFTNPNRLIENALNINGIDHFKQADYTNNGSNLVNMLIYNSNKFELAKQDFITEDINGNSLVRVIDFYTLYYKDPELKPTSDTTFITFVVAHLKAGNSSTDEAERTRATAAIMEYLENNNLRGNVILGGDLNVYNGNGTAFQNLVNYSDNSLNFFDPVNSVGNWSSNSAYNQFHTQSTRVTSNGCLSGGGMDDRFDHILINNAVKNNTAGVNYINNSFKVIGQDGQRYNQSIIFPQNFSVPKGIDTALYNLSDHLPVKIDVTIEKDPVGVKENASQFYSVEIQYPIIDKIIFFNLPESHQENLKIDLYNVTGQLVLSTNLFSGIREINIGNLGLNKGIYFLKASKNSQVVMNKKIIKL